MMRDRVDAALLLARTTRNLRSAQLVHRVRLRAQRFPPSRPLASRVLDYLPTRVGPFVGWPAGFVPLDRQQGAGFPTPEDNAEGSFSFLNDSRDLGDPVDWSADGAARLWRYHLHYMEWAWSFAVHPDQAWAREEFGALWRSWERSSRFGVGDTWSPYVASLRAWVLCGVYRSLVAGTGLQADVDRSLARHARFLRWHVEHDVGGNHLLKNLKALLGLGVFLGDEGVRTMATRAIERQLTVQILSDGGHYERSPSYHCQVLGDLIDCDALLAVGSLPPVVGLAGAIARMRAWLGLMRMPDGDVPLFNDCVLVGAERLRLLQPGPPATERLTVLPASGYVVMRPDERRHLVADVGDPCPPNLPAHAHADCLSFELAIDGRRTVVDTGTSTYEHGARRSEERSTAAHNTVTVDGADQTEVWATFRAARLARAHLERVDDDGRTISVTASHDGYRRLPGRLLHRRTWSVSPTEVEIVDEITGEGRHTIEARVHLSAGAALDVRCSQPPGAKLSSAGASVATGFGQVHTGTVVTAAWQGSLPVTLRTELHFGSVLLQGSGRASTAPRV